MASEAGKGSKRRPSQIDDKELQDNWDRAFGKKEIDPEEEINQFLNDDDLPEMLKGQAI